MARFADPSKVEVVSLGACQCPGAPHERDEATVRWDLSASALARIGQAQITAPRDFYAPYRALIVEAVAAWNLLVLYEDKPVPAPIVPAVVAELDEATLDALGEAIDTLIQNKGPLPNDSGALSPASPQESASPAPTTTPKPGT
jgi:hypothetical protein